MTSWTLKDLGPFMTNGTFDWDAMTYAVDLTYPPTPMGVPDDVALVGQVESHDPTRPGWVTMPIVEAENAGAQYTERLENASHLTFRIPGGYRSNINGFVTMKFHFADHAGVKRSDYETRVEVMSEFPQARWDALLQLAADEAEHDRVNDAMEKAWLEYDGSVQVDARVNPHKYTTYKTKSGKQYRLDKDGNRVYQPESTLIQKVLGYAAETHNGDLHVQRWKQAATALGYKGFDVMPLTLVEAKQLCTQFSKSRWQPVVDAIQALEDAQPPSTDTSEPIDVAKEVVETKAQVQSLEDRIANIEAQMNKNGAP